MARDPEKARVYQTAYRETHPEKVRARHKAYRQAHPEEVRARGKAYRETHSEEILASQRMYREAHLDERRAYQRAYEKAHRDEANVRKKAYRETHREELRVDNRAYKVAHPEKDRAQVKRHRALKRGAAICDFTHAQWVEMQAAYDHRCVYCGKRAKGHLTQDHITPLSQGGNHTLSNIVPACRSCNSKKGTGTALVPIQPLML